MIKSMGSTLTLVFIIFIVISSYVWYNLYSSMKLVEPWMDVVKSVGGYNKSYFSACSSDCVFMQNIAEADVQQFATTIDKVALDAFLNSKKVVICAIDSASVPAINDTALVKFCTAEPSVGLAEPSVGLADSIISEIRTRSSTLAAAINAMNSNSNDSKLTINSTMTVDSLCGTFNTEFVNMPITKFVILRTQPTSGGTIKSMCVNALNEANYNKIKSNCNNICASIGIDSLSKSMKSTFCSLFQPNCDPITGSCIPFVPPASGSECPTPSGLQKK